MYEPLFRHRPRHRWTNGDLAARVGVDLGLPPDDEQQWILDTIFAEKAPERPASFEVGVISPRQNIKTSTLGIAALADLFVFGVERHLWTAHHGDTLKGTFNDFRAWIKSNPEYDEQVTFYEGHQDMSIVHKDTGNTIDFQSRTGKAGRGLTGVKRITLDEALYLEPKHVGAVYPTMLTRPGAQVRVASSAGLVDSEQLRRLRDRGRAAKDTRLAWVEYGATRKPCLRVDCTHAVGSEGCALDDRDLWWQANPALWSGRIDEAALEDQRNAMPPEEFMREFLSWWEAPLATSGGALSIERWADLAADPPPVSKRLAWGADLDETGIGSIALAWRRSDGKIHAQLATRATDSDDVRLASLQLVDRSAELRSRYGGRVYAGGGAAKILTAAEMVDGGEFAAACEAVAELISDSRLLHCAQTELDRAVAVARWRQVGTAGQRAWQLKDAPGIGPLAALTRAVHGVLANSGPPPSPVAVSTSTVTSDLDRINF
jgi:hypothetical protein